MKVFKAESSTLTTRVLWRTIASAVRALDGFRELLLVVLELGIGSESSHLLLGEQNFKAS